MRYDRDTTDRGGAYDRDGTAGVLQNLAAYPDSSTSIFARFQIEHLLSGYPDTDSDTKGALLLALAAHADSGTDIHAALLLALASYIETESSEYSRLQISHNLAVRDVSSVPTDCGRQTYDRMTYDREYTQALTPTLTGTATNVYARLQLTNLLAGQSDTGSSEYARLQIAHNLKAQIDTASSIYAQLRQVDSWTFTFAGTLAAGKKLCIDTRDFTVKNDGVNAIASFTGEFPSIFTGTNWVIYTDSEGSRTVTLVVSKRDRKV